MKLCSRQRKRKKTRYIQYVAKTEVIISIFLSTGCQEILFSLFWSVFIFLHHTLRVLVSGTVASTATCNTSDIVYLLECRGCGLRYVGETGQVLHQRVDGHRGDISKRRLDNKPVSQHSNMSLSKRCITCPVVLQDNTALTTSYSNRTLHTVIIYVFCFYNFIFTS